MTVFLTPRPALLTSSILYQSVSITLNDHKHTHGSREPATGMKIKISKQTYRARKQLATYRLCQLDCNQQASGWLLWEASGEGRAHQVSFLSTTCLPARRYCARTSSRTSQGLS